MHKNLGRAAAVMAVLAMTMSVGTALAAESDTESYGWRTGQLQNRTRHAQYAQVDGQTADAEREEFFEKNGIGQGGAYRDAPHLEAEALADAGVIDQDTADRITEYAAQKHTGLCEWYAEKSDDLTPQGRHAYFESRRADMSGGDCVEELLEAGIITQDQAEAIRSYLAQ